MEYKVLLNFLPFKEQNFEYTVYRKENKRGTRTQFNFDVYSNTLPINHENLNDRTGYWITFESKDGFEEFICKPEYNNKLTLHYLYYCLINKVKNKFNNNKIIIPENNFKKIIYIVLNVHKEGKECLQISPYYLASEKKFGFIIDFKFLKEKDIQFNRKVQQLSLSLDENFKSNSNFYIDKYEKLKQFKTDFYSKIFPMQIGDKQIDLEESFISVKADTLKTKMYLVGNSKESNSQFVGIKEYGPYKSSDNKIILVFFFKSEHKQFASDLANALLGKTFLTFSGLEKFYKIPKIEIKGREISEENLIQSFNDEVKINQNVTFIPIIILSRKEEEKYYTIKYEALKNYNQAVQFVTLELLKNKESLKWSVSNIGLQIFAKLGGIPWLVKPETQKALIIGIGQSHELQKRNGRNEITKYFAYSVLTDSSGTYKELKSVGKYDQKDEYLQELSKHIKDTVIKYTNDFDHFVIHCPFKIRRFELNKIEETLKEFNNNKTFVVIKINTENKYFGFNLDSNSLVPYESTIVQLSTNEFLIWFEGLQYHNPNMNKRIAGPTHIEFYYSNKDLSIDEKKSYLQDVLNLSGANWRGFNSKFSPISIHYARLVSKFIKNFKEDINIEDIKPWFL
ncbi:MAG TPA: Piwi domain-containing protein [Bacteroidia bacterium]|nr:Piwi domain-containing protein [Bacteroidia bacterium]HRS59351.1 Piwi domain-containing protein [Bacteroidia bacterium]